MIVNIHTSSTVILYRIADRKGLATKRWTSFWNTHGGLGLIPCTVGTILPNTFYRTSARAALADLLGRYEVEMDYSVTVSGSKITVRNIWLVDQIGHDLGRRFAGARCRTSREPLTDIYAFRKRRNDLRRRRQSYGWLWPARRYIVRQ